MQVSESLEDAWQVFKRHTGALVAATFALILSQLVLQALLARTVHFPLSFALNLLVFGLVIGGLMNVARLASRGQEPTLADAFAPCKARQGDYLLVGLAFGAGGLVFIVGALVTSYLFLFAPLLVVDGRDFKTALRQSKDLMVANVGEVLGLFLALVALNVLGVITFIGWLAALPISALMVVNAYERLRARSLTTGGAAAPTP
jgi:membrane-anchored glycerophosphoryl diester phosphodiesterase (GDPDase)